MFGLFEQKPKGNISLIKIDGMHCVSCSLNIDGTLEDLDGVFESKTSYAKGETKVVWDPEKMTEKKLKNAIISLGYSIK